MPGRGSEPDVALSRQSALYQRLRLARNAAVNLAKRLPAVSPTCSVHPTSNVAHDLQAGPYVFVGRRCIIPPGVRIGKYAMLASNVAIVGDDHQFDLVGVPSQFSGRPEQSRTCIGDDAWVGHGVIIMRGVTIGAAAVVAAGAVVTKSVPEAEIWGGVPARKIRDRFESEEDRAAHLKALAGPPIAPSFAEPREAYEAVTDAGQ